MLPYLVSSYAMGRLLEFSPNFTISSSIFANSEVVSLWIDAMCTNQGEADEQARKEKYSQILLMREIYGAATGALVWLGELRNIYNSLHSIIEEILHLACHNEFLSLKSE